MVAVPLALEDPSLECLSLLSSPREFLYLPLELFDGAVLDVDDLLIGSEKLALGRNLHAEAFVFALKDLGVPMDSSHCSRIRALVEDTSSRDLLLKLYHLAGEDFLRSKGIENEEQLGQAMEGVRREYMVACAENGLIPLLEGARELIKTLALTGKKIGIYTCSRRNVMEPVLNLLLGDEISPLIPDSFRVYGDEVNGRRKPHPDGWLKAAEKMGVDPSRLLAVDNSPHGIRGALDAGYKIAVGVNWGETGVFDVIREAPTTGAFREVEALTDLCLD